MNFLIDTQTPQLDKHGKLHHFLTVEGLDKHILNQILDVAETYINKKEKDLCLTNKVIASLFFEASTRTLCSFELAAKRLSADVLSFNVGHSSTKKGESLLDTVHTLEAMQVDMLIVRHSESGAVEYIARHLNRPIAVINAGDGCHAHPTQAMLDMLTIRRHKKTFDALSVAIVGDILHSRVARSQIQALTTLGCQDIRIIAPNKLLPKNTEELGVSAYTNMEEGLTNVDVIITLRLQKERMHEAVIPNENEFFRLYGLTTEKLKLAHPQAIVMHPGPMNRGVEIASDVADGPQSVILEQVQLGVAVRMAIIKLCLDRVTHAG